VQEKMQAMAQMVTISIPSADLDGRTASTQVEKDWLVAMSAGTCNKPAALFTAAP
jgi:hypothetical protein